MGSVANEGRPGKEADRLSLFSVLDTHGPWPLANRPALALALPNAYFSSLGIPPLTARP